MECYVKIPLLNNVKSSLQATVEWVDSSSISPWYVFRSLIGNLLQQDGKIDVMSQSSTFFPVHSPVARLNVREYHPSVFGKCSLTEMS